MSDGAFLLNHPLTQPHTHAVSLNSTCINFFLCWILRHRLQMLKKYSRKCQKHPMQFSPILEWKQFQNNEHRSEAVIFNKIFTQKSMLLVPHVRQSTPLADVLPTIHSDHTCKFHIFSLLPKIWQIDRIDGINLFEINLVSSIHLSIVCVSLTSLSASESKKSAIFFCCDVYYYKFH